MDLEEVSQVDSQENFSMSGLVSWISQEFAVFQREDRKEEGGAEIAEITEVQIFAGIFGGVIKGLLTIGFP